MKFNSNRDLDALVAQKIFGAEVVYDDMIFDYVDVFTKKIIPNYSTDAESAKLVLKKVTGKDGNVTNPELLIREALDLYR